MSALDFDYMLGLVPVILGYVPLTLFMAVAAMVLALALASLLAVVRVLKVPVLDRLVALFISFFRGTPLWCSSSCSTTACRRFFSSLTAIDGVTAAIMGLTLHFAAYMAEAIRGAITGVDRSQWEASQAVGMTQGQALRRIILPQAARIAAPTLVNYFIDMIKSTSLAFTLGVTEMMGATQKEAAGSFRYFEAFLVVAILYWMIVEALSVVPAADGGAAAPGLRAMIRVEGLTKRFGADTVLDRDRPRHRRRRAHRHHRPLGHRQVDAAALPQLPRPARRRPDHPRRPAPSTPRTRPRRRHPGAAPAHRLRVPELRALRQQDRAPEHHRGAGDGEGRRPARDGRRPRRRGARRDRPRATAATPTRRRSPAASSSGSASAGRWRSTPS